MRWWLYKWLIGVVAPHKLMGWLGIGCREKRPQTSTVARIAKQGVDIR